MQKKKRWITAGLLILTVGVIIGASFYYGTYIHDILEKETNAYAQELAQQSIKLINERVDNDYLYLEGISDSIGGQNINPFSEGPGYSGTEVRHYTLYKACRGGFGRHHVL